MFVVRAGMNNVFRASASGGAGTGRAGLTRMAALSARGSSGRRLPGCPTATPVVALWQPLPVRAQQKPVVGWREWVELPELLDAAVKAKVDTGARTSALHAFRLRVDRDGDGTTTASFEVHPRQRSTADSVRVTCSVTGFRDVRSSDGRSESRPVIVTPVSLGGSTWPIEVTLTSRDAMGFRMLLGRSALKRRFLVDPGRSYLLSRAPSTEPGGPRR